MAVTAAWFAPPTIGPRPLQVQRAGAAGLTHDRRSSPPDAAVTQVGVDGRQARPQEACVVEAPEDHVAHIQPIRGPSEAPTPGTSERGRATAGSRGTLAVIPSSTCAFAIRNPTRNPGTNHP